MYYAHKKFTVTANEIEEDGMLDTMYGSQPVFKGSMLLCDLEGNTFAVTKERFNEYYVPVKLAKSGHKRKLSPFEEQYIKAYGDFTGKELNQEEDESYINGQKKLIQNKPL